MRVLTVNNPDDEKFLRTPTKEFVFADHSPEEVEQLISDMRVSMKDHDGMGLAANQVGLPHRVFIAEPPVEGRSKKFYAIFNPIIESVSEDKIDNIEGCLSVPNTSGLVSRHTRLTITAQDQFGRPLRLKVSGVLARIFQHEIDHLNGVLFVDKATDIQKEK